MSQRDKPSSSTSPNEIVPPPFHNSSTITKFHPISHTLITITQLILSTLCLLYIPSTKLLDDPVRCLNVTTMTLFFVQFLIESSRWLLYLQGDGIETNKSIKAMLKNLIEHKGENFAHALWITLFGAFMFHLIAIVFGAPAIDPESIPEKLIYYTTVATVVGAWLGAIVIPLDWDRPWQVWPIPCVIGGFVGHIVGSIISLFVCYFSGEGDNIQKKRE
ncbi:35474_t:CDS:2 [Gigaspora margarita]|uniref:35474_t:CDS:1 n=1 Tax=Gigaspora margarita TaxID=4874 RepID=A0ABM8W2A3_GIGMA|nr:35474_t:CDS:2 [Gigaspora margarita]